MSDELRPGTGRQIIAADVRDAVNSAFAVVEGEPQAAEQRSWSLPASPPDDVTVEYRVTVTRPDGAVLTTYAGDDRYVAERMAGADGCRAEERTVSPWRELSVVEGEPQAAEQPAPDDHGYGPPIDLAEAAAAGTWPYSPATPEPPRFERGFYRLARDLDLGRPVKETVPAGAQVAVIRVGGEDCSLWYPGGSGSTWSVPVAALAAAGAERVEGEQA